MPFVERDKDGTIKGVYGPMQPGIAEEELPADHPDVVAFLSPKQPPKPRDALAELDALKASLKSAKSIADINAAATVDVAVDALTVDSR